MCSSVALNALWKVECWACLAVSLDTALGSFRSKDIPFALKRNLFWGSYYVAKEPDMTEGSFPGFAGVLESCHRGNHMPIFHEIPILPTVVTPFLYCSFHMRPWVPSSSYFGWNNKA